MSENNTQKLILIDPPSGWMHGFPRAITQKQYKKITSLKEWCIENGYPKKEADSYGECFYVSISGELPKIKSNIEKQADLVEEIGFKNLKVKEPIVYTEEEVKLLLKEYGNMSGHQTLS